MKVKYEVIYNPETHSLNLYISVEEKDGKSRELPVVYEIPVYYIKDRVIGTLIAVIPNEIRKLMSDKDHQWLKEAVKRLVRKKLAYPEQDVVVVDREEFFEKYYDEAELY